MDRLEHMARTKTGRTGPLTTLGWVAALAFVVFGGIAVAAAFLTPGLALAGGLPANATGAHPWITDGGTEVAQAASWRLEIMLEYLAAGLAVLILSLRFGKTLMVKLQDWYEGAPLVPAKPLPLQVPATVIPRPRPLKAANDRRDRELHAA